MIIIFISFYILSVIVTIGYGWLISKFLFEEKMESSLAGIFGIFFLTFLSYLTSFFLKHDFLHNIPVFFLGLVFFVIFYKKKEFDFKLLSIILIIAFINFLIFKNHDDFPYYHFPYVNYLNEFSLNLGVGKFNHGFRTPSSIFYLNSLFYLPLIKSYGFNIGAILFFIFSNYYFLKKILNDINIKNINFITYYNLISLALINVFFYRIAEHGTDRSAQILILILFSEIFLFYNQMIKLKLQHVNKNIFNIFLLLTLIISLKAFYILYVIFLIPIFYTLLSNQKLKSKITDIIFNKITITSTLFIFLIFLIYFINTGCIIYPLSLSCIQRFDWTIDKMTVDHMRQWYELWSKAGATPNYRVENPEIYIQGFNWVSNWIQNYFFNKVSDFLAGLIFLCVIMFLVFYKKKTIYKKKNYLFILFILNFILLIDWFFNHPALRYGGYILFFNIFSIPFAYILSGFVHNQKKEIYKIFVLLFIIFAIGLSRNVNRVLLEHKKYNYVFFENSFYKIDNDHYRISNKLKKIILNYKECLLKKDNENQCINKNKVRYDDKLKAFVFLNK